MKMIKELRALTRPHEALHKKGVALATSKELAATLISVGAVAVDVRAVTRHVAGRIRRHKTDLNLDHLLAVSAMPPAKISVPLAHHDSSSRVQ